MGLHKMKSQIIIQLLLKSLQRKMKVNELSYFNENPSQGIFSACNKQQYYPREFKMAIVVSIHMGRSSDSGTPSSYRSESLLRSWTALNWRLAKTPEKLNFLSDEQFDFQRSTEPTGQDPIQKRQKSKKRLARI